MNINRLTIVLALFAIGLTACSKDEGPVPFPAGTATLYMMNEENGRTTLGNSDVYITAEGNFRSAQFPIFDVGETRGIGQIEMPDFVNMASEVAVRPRHGYVICSPRDIVAFPSRTQAIAENAAVYRVWVDSWIRDQERVTGANVRFLLGRPDEQDRMPAWGSDLGALNWNDTESRSETLRIAIPASDPKEVEVIFPYEEEVPVGWTLRRNELVLNIERGHFDPTEYRMRIRCHHIYTEVTLRTDYVY